MAGIIISAFKRAFGESVRAPAPRTAHRGRRQGGSLQPQFGHRGRGDPGRGKQAGAFVRGRCRTTRKSRSGRADAGVRVRTAVSSAAACGPRYGKAPDHLDRNRPDARTSSFRTRRPETRPARIVSNCDTDKRGKRFTVWEGRASGSASMEFPSDKRGKRFTVWEGRASGSASMEFPSDKRRKRFTVWGAPHHMTRASNHAGLKPVSSADPAQWLACLPYHACEKEDCLQEIQDYAPVRSRHEISRLVEGAVPQRGQLSEGAGSRDSR